MSLDFDVSKIKNYKHVTTSPDTRGLKTQKWHPVTDALIWGAMLCGYRSITKDNAQKIATRIAQFQHVTGARLSAQSFPQIYITLEDVEKHIGLSTNASELNDAQWAKKLASIVAEESRTIVSGERNARTGPIGVISERTAMSAYDICELMCEQNAADEKRKQLEAAQLDAQG